MFIRIGVYMFDENQLVETKWNGRTKKYYESKGYKYTKVGDVFFVKAKDLKPNSHEHVEVICDFCGKSFYPTMNDYSHHSDKDVDSCNHCKFIKSSMNTFDKRAREQFDKLREVCAKNDYELITKESEYTGCKMNVEFICKKHGVQTLGMYGMINNGYKCKMCAYEERAKNQAFSKDYVKSVIESVNGNKLLNADEYTKTRRSNLKVVCGLCGNVYNVGFYWYVYNNQTRCPSCANKESKPEAVIREFLTSHKIIFEQEKRFNDCRDTNPLPFDFYLPEENLIIEFDGQHHFGDIGRGDYETVKRHDKIKNDYCALNNIEILRIPYWKGNNIEEIITDKLNL